MEEQQLVVEHILSTMMMTKIVTTMQKGDGHRLLDSHNVKSCYTILSET